MGNTKSDLNLRIVILSGILVGIVIISGCIQSNEIKEKINNINPGNNNTGSGNGSGNGSGSGFDKNLPGIDRNLPGVDRNLSDFDKIANESNNSGIGGSGSGNVTDPNINFPDIEKYTNNSKIGIAGPNGRIYYTYVNNDPNFSINYPANWSMLPDISKITFLSQKHYEGGYFSMVMQLLSSSDSGGTYKSVDDVITDLVQKYKDNNNISNITINYERGDTLSGSQGKELNISYRQFGFNYTQTQIIARGGKYFYMIMYIAQSEHYSEYADVYEYSKSHFKME
jgi:hypothetical protein